MESTCVHVSQSIHNEVDKQYYIKAMRRCYYICSDEAHGNDIYRMRWEISRLMSETRYNFRPTLELFSHSKRYYIMGIEHSLDIVNSMIVRFCEGYSHPDDVFINNILSR